MKICLAAIEFGRSKLGIPVLIGENRVKEQLKNRIR